MRPSLVRDVLFSLIPVLLAAAVASALSGCGSSSNSAGVAPDSSGASQAASPSTTTTTGLGSVTCANPTADFGLSICGGGLIASCNSTNFPNGSSYSPQVITTAAGVKLCQLKLTLLSQSFYGSAPKVQNGNLNFGLAYTPSYNYVMTGDLISSTSVGTWGTSSPSQGSSGCDTTMGGIYHGHQQTNSGKPMAWSAELSTGQFFTLAADSTGDTSTIQMTESGNIYFGINAALNDGPNGSFQYADGCFSATVQLLRCFDDNGDFVSCPSTI